MTALATLLFSFSAIGLVLLWVQHRALFRHLRQPVSTCSVCPGISILKPLCGVDDELWANLEVFCELDYPQYEILLGVKNKSDPAYSLARRAQARWPHRFRVVLQRGEVGYNPKVNQLVTLAAAARFDILAVSDSNVRVARNYLREIAACLSDPQVGLVTHPLAGVGELTLGARMDNLHLTTGISPGVIAAKRVAGKDLVVAKSMALRRGDLEAFGGFEALKNVLAEDYVAGRLVVQTLNKKVALAVTPVRNVCCSRSVGEFVRRYARWSVMQKRVAGRFLYVAMLLLNPIFLSSLALILIRDRRGLAAWTAVVALKSAIDALTEREVFRTGLNWRWMAVVPIKDLLVAAAWFCGLLSNRVNWRGNQLLVLKGTRLVPASPSVARRPRTDGWGRNRVGTGLGATLGRT